jgi:hypothetical protein
MDCFLIYGRYRTIGDFPSADFLSFSNIGRGIERAGIVERLGWE